MSERASIFDGDSDFDVSKFAPKQSKAKTETSAEAVRAVAEGSDFRSREPAPKKAPAEKERRRYTTGRNVQLNIKVRSETLDAFYSIADAEKWVLGETLERAVAALQRELDTKPGQRK